LSSEKEEDYTWAMEAFRELISKHGIAEPFTLVTDRELALIKALDHLFPDSAHILYTWHVNINILANCRKHFSKDQQSSNGNIIPDPKWEAFLKD
jgi:hypothetical protein